MKKFIFILCFALSWYCNDSYGQARLILQGASVVIAQGAYLVVDNPATDAITRNTGFLVSEGEHNFVKWNIGTSTGTYTIPWGYEAAYIPLTFTKTAGSGNGDFLFSTYHTGWQNSAELPTDVSNMNGASGTDNSVFAADRFWQIKAQNYTTKPMLSSLEFTYIDAELSATGNTINENSLRANRFNTSLASWTDVILESALNTVSNTVTVTSVDIDNLYDWWVVGMLGTRLYWVAPSNSTSNLSANWSLNSGGSGNAGIPSLVDVLIFDGNSTANSTIDVDLTVANLVIDAGYTGNISQGGSKIALTNTATFSGGTFSGGTADIVIDGEFTLSGTHFTSTSATLELKENLIVNGGSFAHNNGTVNFSGTAMQHISGLVENTFNHILVTNTTANPGVSIESSQNLLGVLSLNNNVVFDADGSNNNAVFTLLSSDDEPTNDAAIGILPTGAHVTGNVTVQRFMTRQGGTNQRIYRYISAPVQQGTIADIQNEIPVTGSFTGSSNCSGCSTNPSLFFYEETVITDLNGSGTADFNDGYIAFPDVENIETFVPGLGYALYTRGDILTSTLWDLRGIINAGNIAPVTLPVSYTSSGSSVDDGWNLVGNPFPSTIDWNSSNGWTKSNVDGAIYITDNGSSTALQYATWNGVTGTNGGTQYIATAQAFWVKANGSGTPVLQADENVKKPGTQTTFFRVGAPENLLRITLTQGSVRDETVIHFRDDATSIFDSHADAVKFANGTFNLSSMISDGMKLAINSLNSLGCHEEIRLVVEHVLPGSYHLTFSELSSFTAGTIVQLRDKFTNQTILLENESSYAFTVTDNTATFGADRFAVIITGPPIPITIQITGNTLSVPYTDGIQWFFNDLPILGATQSSIKPESTGTYSVVIYDGGCKVKGSIEFLVTAIEESMVGGLTIYPNPVGNVVFVRVEKAQIQSIILLNSLGHSIGQIRFDQAAGSSVVGLNMENIVAGVYFLTITADGNTFVKKIVKE
ncbi:MAG: T9SS type A sorting domain-containing protein [Cyclobacteriaceae bacterium]|nr:T9SS type A sorting domain-containing protein [Cyclobacteriaceae bacterium]